MMSVQFQSTIWTQIRKAKEQDENALNDFILKYQEPVRNYIIEKGIKPQDADDITQDVFTTIFENRILERAEQKKGRLRSLLLAVTNNVLKNFHRRKTISPELKDELVDIVEINEASEEFDQHWMMNIIKIALEKLRHESQQIDIPYYETIKLFILEDMDHATIAKRLSLTLDQVNNYIHRGKSKLIAYISAEIESYSSSKEEYQDELKIISKYLEQ